MLQSFSPFKPQDEGGPHGRLGHGRLLRIAADRLERAAAGGELEVEVAGSEELRVSVEGVPFTLGEVVREEAEVGGANNEVRPAARSGACGPHDARATSLP